MKEELDDEFFDQLFNSGSNQTEEKSPPAEPDFSEPPEVPLEGVTSKEEMERLLTHLRGHAIYHFTKRFNRHNAVVVANAMMEFSKKLLNDANSTLGIAEIAKKYGIPEEAVRVDVRALFVAIMSYGVGYADGRADAEAQRRLERLRGDDDS